MRILQRFTHLAALPLTLGRSGGLLAFLLGGLTNVLPNSVRAQQQLVLTADVGKSQFFQDEPIYLLLRLQNIGTDTARVPFFSLFSPAVKLSFSQGHGNLTPVAKPVFDIKVARSWSGIPVPPGASILKTVVLQDIMGDEQDVRNHLYAHHLTPDAYEVDVEFDAHWGLSSTPVVHLRAEPISFVVRERTPAEEAEFRVLEEMRTMVWDTTRAGSGRALAYHDSLLNLVAKLLRERPDDAFLPFLLSHGVYAMGKGLQDQILADKARRFDPDTSELLSQYRLALIDRHKHSSTGALLVQALAVKHPEEMEVIAEQLRNTPAGDMAQYQMERRHAQPSNHQPPR